MDQEVGGSNPPSCTKHLCLRSLRLYSLICRPQAVPASRAACQLACGFFAIAPLMRHYVRRGGHTASTIEFKPTSTTRAPNALHRKPPIFEPCRGQILRHDRLHGLMDLEVMPFGVLGPERHYGFERRAVRHRACRIRKPGWAHRRGYENDLASTLHPLQGGVVFRPFSIWRKAELPPRANFRDRLCYSLKPTVRWARLDSGSGSPSLLIVTK